MYFFYQPTYTKRGGGHFKYFMNLDLIFKKSHFAIFSLFILPYLKNINLVEKTFGLSQMNDVVSPCHSPVIIEDIG